MRGTILHSSTLSRHWVHALQRTQLVKIWQFLLAQSSASFFRTFNDTKMNPMFRVTWDPNRMYAGTAEASAEPRRSQGE